MRSKRLSALLGLSVAQRWRVGWRRLGLREWEKHIARGQNAANFDETTAESGGYDSLTRRGNNNLGQDLRTPREEET